MRGSIQTTGANIREYVVEGSASASKRGQGQQLGEVGTGEVGRGEVGGDPAMVQISARAVRKYAEMGRVLRGM
jgi:hypothetical protein